MLKSIRLCGVASFTHSKPVEIEDLSQFNYFFGENGSGKTTIGRVIADAGSPPTGCVLRWEGGEQSEVLVYNKDFVERNFVPYDEGAEGSGEIKGIFTLGEEEKGIREAIDKAKREVDNLKEEVQQLRGTLGGPGEGKVGELGALEKSFTDTCWNKTKERRQGNFRQVLEGQGLGSKGTFRENVLKQSVANKAEVLELADLEAKAEQISDNPTRKDLVEVLPSIPVEALSAHESNPVMKKRVVGKEDVDIAKMIEKLGNSDWVRQGRQYFHDDTCPFCQQSTAEAFAEQLNEYFDEESEGDIRRIDQLKQDYSQAANAVLARLGTLVESPPDFLDSASFQGLRDAFARVIEKNTAAIDQKKREPSREMELSSSADALSAIKTSLAEVNKQIGEHNDMVENIGSQRSDLREKVWQYIVGRDLRSEIEQYAERKGNLEKAIGNLNEKISERERQIQDKKEDIKELSRKTTSVMPTIEAINSLLKGFNFEGFRLVATQDEKNYKLVRADGADVKDDLSEGEKTLVTFLYFYHLLRGAHTEGGLGAGTRVVVFDDPVSSLDSNSLFIVSTLIKQLCSEVEKASSIKQVIVLTHNAYFYKQVLYPSPLGVLQDKAQKRFFVVRKMGMESHVEPWKESPIQSHYELLWADLKWKQKASSDSGVGPISIQNTMRRILEYYFNIFGYGSHKRFVEGFAGQEQLIARALLAWIDDGSHSAQDDLLASPAQPDIEGHFKVFKKIFDKAGYVAHHDHMMGLGADTE